MESQSLVSLIVLVLMLIGTSLLFARETLQQSHLLIPIPVVNRWSRQVVLSPELIGQAYFLIQSVGLRKISN